MGDSELRTLIDLLEHTFGKEQIQAFGRNFEKDHTKFRSINELLLYASGYIGESRRPLNVEDLRWIVAYGVYQVFFFALTTNLPYKNESNNRVSKIIDQI